jgi:beta-xylosidase
MIGSTLKLFMLCAFITPWSCFNNDRGKIASPTVKVYHNPLKVALADPYVLYDAASKTYYMYGTGGAKDGFVTYSSADLVNWKNEGQVFWGNTKGSWGISAFWAPEVYSYNGKYYMFYSAQWRQNPLNDAENFKIGIAVSNSPKGSFKVLSNKPLFDPGYPIIDANVFFDTNGKIYLYYSRCCYKHAVKSEIADLVIKKGMYKKVEESWVYGVEIKPDFSGVVGKPVMILRPPVKLSDKQSEWESRSVLTGEVNRRWTEGSTTFKHRGTYYIMYSANFYGGENYAVGYATSKSPLGPYQKASNNPVLQKNTLKGGEVTGTGHNSIVYSADRKSMYCVYHGRTKASGDERVVFIDRMTINNQGVLQVAGPTTTNQPYPKAR